MQITYEDQAKMLTTIIEADDKALAARAALIQQIRFTDLVSVDKLAKSTDYRKYKERYFDYEILGITQLQTIPLMIDGRHLDVLMADNNDKLKKLKPIKKNKLLKPYSVDIEWIAEGKHRQLKSVLLADNKREARVKALLSLCRTTDEWDILDQIEVDGEYVYDITVDGSRYIASPAIPMELIDIAIKSGCVTALIPMRTNVLGEPIVATLGLPHLSLIDGLSDSSEYQ